MSFTLNGNPPDTIKTVVTMTSKVSGTPILMKFTSQSIPGVTTRLLTGVEIAVTKDLDVGSS